MSTTAPPKALTRSLFLAFACFYLLLLGGHIYTIDGVLMARVAQNIVDEQTCAVPWEKGYDPYGLKTDDAFYPKYGLGPSAAAMPTYLLGKLLAPLHSSAERDLFAAHERPGPFGGKVNGIRGETLIYKTGPEHFEKAFGYFAVSWTNAFVSAGLLVCLLLLLCELGHSLRVSLWTTMLAGVASPVLPYAKTFFAEPLGGLCLMASLLMLVRASRHDEGRNRRLLLAGIWLGCTALAKIAHVVLVVPAILYVVLDSRRREGRNTWQELGRSAAGFAIPMVIVALYNLVRFGSLTETGYGAEVSKWTTPFFSGFFGLLISPGRGLFLYFPAALLALGALWFLHRRHRAAAWFVGTSLLVLVLVYSRWWMWEGGWCYGPRFLVPAIPLLFLPLAELLTSFRERALAWRIALVVLLAGSLLLAWIGTVVNFVDFSALIHDNFERNAQRYVQAGVRSPYDLIRWDWKFAPINRYWGLPLKDYLLLPHALHTPGIVAGWFVVVAAGAVTGVVRVALLLRRQ